MYYSSLIHSSVDELAWFAVFAVANNATIAILSTVPGAPVQAPQEVYLGLEFLHHRIVTSSTTPRNADWSSSVVTSVNTPMSSA